MGRSHRGLNETEITQVKKPGVPFKTRKHWRWLFVRRHGLPVSKRTNCKPKTKEERTQMLRTYLRSSGTFMAQSEVQYCLATIC